MRTNWRFLVTVLLMIDIMMGTVYSRPSSRKSNSICDIKIEFKNQSEDDWTFAAARVAPFLDMSYLSYVDFMPFAPFGQATNSGPVCSQLSHAKVHPQARSRSLMRIQEKESERRSKPLIEPNECCTGPISTWIRSTTTMSPKQVACSIDFEGKLVNVTEMAIPQFLDHFSFNTGRATFQQRLFVNDEYWETPPIPAVGKGDRSPAPPIILVLGPTSEFPVSMIATGLPAQLAQTYKGIVLGIERRFFGGSLPFPLLSDRVLSVRQLRYLTTEQILSDAVGAVRLFKTTYASTWESPVIAIGGGIGGSEAVWLRSKFPHVIDGAVSSTPTLDIHNSLDFNAAVSKELGPVCSELTRIVFDYLTQSFMNPDERSKQLISSSFSWWPYADSLFTGNSTDTMFLNAMTNLVTGVTSVNYSTRFWGPSFDDLKVYCDSLPSSGSVREMVVRFSEWASDVWVWQRDIATDIKRLRAKADRISVSTTAPLPTVNDRVVGTRFFTNFIPSAWLQCTELGWIKGPYNPDAQLFSVLISSEDFLDACAAVFHGVQLIPDQRGMMLSYGGLSLESASRILVSWNIHDPWSVTTLRESIVNASVRSWDLYNVQGSMSELYPSLAYESPKSLIPPDIITYTTFVTRIVGEWSSNSVGPGPSPSPIVPQGITYSSFLIILGSTAIGGFAAACVMAQSQSANLDPNTSERNGYNGLDRERTGVFVDYSGQSKQPNSEGSYRSNEFGEQPYRTGVTGIESGMAQSHSSGETETSPPSQPTWPLLEPVDHPSVRRDTR